MKTTREIALSIPTGSLVKMLRKELREAQEAAGAFIALAFKLDQKVKNLKAEIKELRSKHRNKTNG